eukprot:7805366-Lingulodinium_polyedra.AAC.1
MTARAPTRHNVPVPAILCTFAGPSVSPRECADANFGGPAPARRHLFPGPRSGASTPGVI